jgi:hypothetical protein
MNALEAGKKASPVDQATDQISNFIYERYIEPALETHTSGLVRHVLESRTFRKVHGLSLESVSRSGKEVLYTFRLSLRRVKRPEKESLS